MTANGDSTAAADQVANNADRTIVDGEWGLEIVGRTDTGRQRSRNEDNFFVLSEHGLCVVADGMGGHADGNVASTCAVQAIQDLAGSRKDWTAPTAVPFRVPETEELTEARRRAMALADTRTEDDPLIPTSELPTRELARPQAGAEPADTEDALDSIGEEDLLALSADDGPPQATTDLDKPLDSTEDDVTEDQGPPLDPDSPGGIEALKDRMRAMIDEANHRIFQRNRGYFSLEGMGTTIVLLHLGERTAITGCVGDSRIYRYRAGKLRQLTQDHSLLEELKRFNVAGGRQFQPLNINKNIITRALGMAATVNSDLEDFPVKREDLYLLCSDGLTDLVEDDQIEEILAEHIDDLATAVDKLVATANEHGGTDNITVVLARRSA